MGFMVGLRLGVAKPFGDAFRGTIVDPEETKAMSDFYGTGGGLELHAGVRFAKYFTGKLMFGGYGFDPGPDAEPDGTAEAENTVSATSAGIGIQIGTPRGRFGGFGELNALFLHTFKITNKFDSCEVSISSKGPALSLGGGLSIPLGTSWSLTPFATAQMGRFEEQEIEEDCGLNVPSSFDIPSDDQKTHGMLFVGIGGEFLFGPDKPAK